MASHARPVRKSVTHLGWPHYWVLTATLGGMLALITFALLLGSGA